MPVVDTWWQTETGGDHDLAAARRHDAAARQRDATVARNCAPTSSTTAANRCRWAAADTSCSRARGPECCAAFGATTNATYRPIGRNFPHLYFAGDGCRRDAEGNYWFMGRIDDVMNVSGHRISTTEVESALVDHPASPRPRSAGSSTI